jgi:hypothetical protein
MTHGREIVGINICIGCENGKQIWLDKTENKEKNIGN